MESFVHLRKGTTPRRLHADLDGLKDDELGRNGFTGRTANFFRRHDPTQFRAAGPLRPVDLLADQLPVGDTPLVLFSNPDCRVLLDRRTDPARHFVRHVDGIGKTGTARVLDAKTQAHRARLGRHVG